MKDALERLEAVRKRYVEKRTLRRTPASIQSNSKLYPLLEMLTNMSGEKGNQDSTPKPEVHPIQFNGELYNLDDPDPNLVCNLVALYELECDLLRELASLYTSAEIYLVAHELQNAIKGVTHASE